MLLRDTDVVTWLYSGHMLSHKDWALELFQHCMPLIEDHNFLATVMTLSFRTDWSGQTVQTQIRLLLEEQSDQGLHCLLFHLHLFDKIPKGLASFLEF